MEASNPKTPGRTISDALRDEDLSRVLRQGEMKERNYVPRDPAAKPLDSDGSFRRVPVRYDQ